jgi:hypothetical protein
MRGRALGPNQFSIPAFLAPAMPCTHAPGALRPVPCVARWTTGSADSTLHPLISLHRPSIFSSPLPLPGLRHSVTCDGKLTPRQSRPTSMPCSHSPHNPPLASSPSPSPPLALGHPPPWATPMHGWLELRRLTREREGGGVGGQGAGGRRQAAGGGRQAASGRWQVADLWGPPSLSLAAVLRQVHFHPTVPPSLSPLTSRLRHPPSTHVTRSCKCHVAGSGTPQRLPPVPAPHHPHTHTPSSTHRRRAHDPEAILSRSVSLASRSPR